MGVSADFYRESFTMDENLNKGCKSGFVNYIKKDYI